MTRAGRLLGTVSFVCAVGCLGCRSASGPSQAVPGHCVPLVGDRLADLLDEHPLDLLSDDVREDLRETLRGASRICLLADAEMVQCNAGGGPKPDIRRCCKFTDTPHAGLFGVARRIGVSRGGEQVVHLAVEPGLTNPSVDRQCDVPTCADDRASATASLTLTGTVETEDGTVDFELPIAVDGRLELACEG